ncbi:ComEC/Rec2 family competence protein [Saliphagus infecundisoli]|uniref:ComEC/Rec2 family competence protein n=1 Tax=Saliphagus infecundisoli TaxID=1849069 RepID=A0ABD5QLC5_9EURY|nr:ComEC/Rec2 family competence protein [Saliphagus infecundisoli]
MRQAVIVALVAVLLLFAGCADSAGQDATPQTDEGDTGTPPDSTETTETEEANTTSTPAESNDNESLNETPSSENETHLSENETAPSDEVNGELEIHHIDVGQADATLIIEPSGETMLIDSGDWRQGGEDVIAYLENQNVKRIDHLVSTHADADHIGGHDAIIEYYETEREGIGAVYDSGVTATSQTYERYLDAIEEHDVELLTVDENDSFVFGDTTVDVLNPPAGDSGSDKQYNSISLTIEFGEFSYLTTGDAEADAEERMADEYGAALESDVYQAGHHGSSTSSTEPFMNQVNPDVAIISSAYDSQYGHPSESVLEDYAAREIETYWTGVHGTIVLTSDGGDYTLETEHEFSTDAEDLLEEKPAEESQEQIAPPIHMDAPPVTP